MRKKYPIYTYLDSINDRYVMFAYKFTEGQMYNDKWNNGLNHYPYFEAMCERYINIKYGLDNSFKKYKYGPKFMTNSNIFFHNILNPTNRIRIINPLNERYSNNVLNSLMNDSYESIIVLSKHDFLDIISMKITGTRAYADLLLKANGLSSYYVKKGQVIKVPLDIISDSSYIFNNSIYSIRLNNKPTIYRLSSIDKFIKPKNGSIILSDPMENTMKYYLYINGERILLFEGNNEV